MGFRSLIFRTLQIIACAFAGCAFAITLSFGQSLKLDRLSKDAQRSCFVQAFSAGWGKLDWPEPGLSTYGENGRYEFRDAGKGRVLVRGYFDLGRRLYTARIYSLDLADPAGKPQVSDESTWEAAQEWPVIQVEGPLVGTYDREPKALVINAISFPKSGDYWSRHASLLSPEKKWIVLQSFSGTRAAGRGPFQGQVGRDRGRVYLDFFDLNGAQMFTVTAQYRDADPTGLTFASGWLAGGYFVLGLGVHRDRILICDLGNR